MLRALVLFFMAVTALGGCVPLDQHAALREAYDKLAAERAANRTVDQTAKKELAKVSGELKQAQQQLADLETRLQKANQEMADLSTQLDTAKKALAAREEERAKSAKEAKEAKPAKPPRKKKP